MNTPLSCRLLPAALCAWALAASAQPTPPAPATAPVPTPLRADPLDARAAVPTLAYASVLARTRGAGAAPPVPWREANDTTARIGGWKAYAREAQPPEARP